MPTIDLIKKRNRKKRKVRFIQIALLLSFIALGTGLISKVFNDNIVFFFSPTDLVVKVIQPSDNKIKIGGLLKPGSLKQDKPAEEFEFVITDGNNDILVIYNGILPNLFKEGQGTVATGYLRNGYFEAKELLAKHDENYIPKEVADTLKKSGYWRHAE
jgi:cytochrome c-type biogenesis protein CcmE